MLLAPDAHSNPPSATLAARIATDAEALAVARALAAAFAEGAASRDAAHSLPHAEVERFSQSGLWAISVPREFGGPGLSYATLAEVVAIISAADPNLGQIPQNHYFLVEALRWSATPAQRTTLFDRVLRGDRLGNALSERHGATVDARTTSLRPAADGWVIDGEKYYSTGVIFAHWVVGSARKPDGQEYFAIVPRTAPGLTIVDDWSAFGQRTTASGTTIFANVAILADAIVPVRAPSGRNLALPVAHIVHAAIDAGIARGAIDAAVSFLKQHARPGLGSGVARATDDPYTIADIGRLTLQLHAAEALLARAGTHLDRASADPAPEITAAATIAVFEAKIAAAEIALAAGSKLIELGGTRATHTDWNLDRFWRNARTHTVHDPIRWRLRAVGEYWLNGRLPNDDKYGAAPTPALAPEGVP